MHFPALSLCSKFYIPPDSDSKGSPTWLKVAMSFHASRYISLGLTLCLHDKLTVGMESKTDLAQTMSPCMTMVAMQCGGGRDGLLFYVFLYEGDIRDLV